MEFSVTLYLNNKSRFLVFSFTHLVLHVSSTSHFKSSVVRLSPLSLRTWISRCQHSLQLYLGAQLPEPDVA
jgi:hypothetical protein